MSVFIQSRSVKLVFKAIHKEQHYKFSPIPPGGGGHKGPVQLLISCQFLVFFLDFLGEFLEFILVFDFN